MGSLFLVVDNCCLIIKEWQQLQAAIDELPEAKYKTWELHLGRRNQKETTTPRKKYTVIETTTFHGSKKEKKNQNGVVLV